MGDVSKRGVLFIFWQQRFPVKRERTDFSDLLSFVCVCAQLCGSKAVSGWGYRTARDGERCETNAISKRRVLFVAIESYAKMRAY